MRTWGSHDIPHRAGQALNARVDSVERQLLGISAWGRSERKRGQAWSLRGCCMDLFKVRRLRWRHPVEGESLGEREGTPAAIASWWRTLHCRRLQLGRRRRRFQQRSQKLQHSHQQEGMAKRWRSRRAGTREGDSNGHARLCRRRHDTTTVRRFGVTGSEL
jgi:hypothetical protein